MAGPVDSEARRTVGLIPPPIAWSAPAVTQDINVLALVKGAERYIFLYDDSRRAETLRILGRYASNSDLSFTWYDAAVLSQKIRQESRASAPTPRFNLPQPSDTDDWF
jgi:hypothetical protein